MSVHKKLTFLMLVAHFRYFVSLLNRLHILSELLHRINKVVRSCYAAAPSWMFLFFFLFIFFLLNCCIAISTTHFSTWINWPKWTKMLACMLLLWHWLSIHSLWYLYWINSGGNCCLIIFFCGFYAILFFATILQCYRSYWILCICIISENSGRLLNIAT